MNSYLRQLRYYAQHNPKASSAALILGTLASCATVVAAIDLRDRYNHRTHAKLNTGSGDTYDEAPSPRMSKSEAQLVAMRETAKGSTWRQNLQNAADAQGRFMLPGQAPGDAPDYVQKIDERSREILKTEKEREERERENKDDPSRSRFWK